MEDKLQDQVQKCISDFVKANIHFWMLTGDKLETAENIAYSCGLFEEYFDKEYILETDDLEQKYNSLLLHI